MNGKYIDFFTTFKDSFQSVLGPSPNFTPNPIYYGLLMSIYVQSNYNDIYIANPTGNMSNVKAYVL